ncbi:MAG TPA: OmpH family outer membrane protein [Planctomycetota bacterium]|nr:OmpH family outer membrane protein [Planctomycetota bacterium]
MRKTTGFVWGVLAAGALAALSLNGGARAQETPPAKALRVGVVNIGDCLNPAKYDFAKDLEAEFNGVRKGIDEELARIRKKADELNKQLDALKDNPGSQLYLDKRSQLDLEVAHFEIVQKNGKSRLLSAKYAASNSMHTEIRKAAAAVAQELKLDLVLRADGAPEEDDKLDESLQKNMLRAVWYCDPSLDITAKVLGRLNEDYKKKRGNGGEMECPQCKIKTKEAKCPRCGASLKN